VVKGWNEALTDSSTKGQLQTILTGWAQQDKNLVLKKVAAQALAPTSKTGGR
jgi:hypothetical protein